MIASISWKPAATTTRRRIWPLSVVFLDRTLMLLAFCTLRQDFRRFRLDLMSEVTLTDTSFRPRRVALLRDFLKILTGAQSAIPSRNNTA